MRSFGAKWACAAWLCVSCSGEPTTRVVDAGAAGSPLEARRAVRLLAPPRADAPTPLTPMADEPGRFVMRRADSAAFFSSKGLAWSLEKEGKRFGLHASLVGAREVTPTPEKQQRASVKRFVAGAQTATATYGQLAWEEVYPGVDMVVEPITGGLEYRFVLSPGADPARIVIDWPEASAVRVVDDGRGLEIETGVGRMMVSGLRAFSVEKDGNQPVEAKHVVEGTRVSLAITGWSGATPLVIDPAVTWSSFVGGSNQENGHAVAVDAAGNMYLTGQTLSADFPTTGGFQTTNGGTGYAHDAFVTKITAGGSIAWSTYLGGSGDEIGWGLALDPAGNVAVVGQTNSTNFPTTTGAYDTTLGGARDAFVTKIDAAGNLLWSTYFGGATGGVGADHAEGVAMDSAGNVFISGSTQSSDLPTTTGAYSTIHRGSDDVFVAKFTSGGALAWSTFLGGTTDEFAHAAWIDSNGDLLVAGETYSTNFPTTSGLDVTFGGGSGPDAFVTKFNASGALLWSTFLGGGARDAANALTTDPTGNIFVVGVTSSSNFPATGGFDATLGGSADAFVTKLTPTGTVAWSSFLGGSAGDYGMGIALDSYGNLALAGFTDSTDFPNTRAFQPSTGGSTDAFVAKVSSSGAYLWSSYIGGSSYDYGNYVAVDPSNSIVVVGASASTNFPIVGGFDTTLSDTGFPYDVFVYRVGQAPLGTACANLAACASSVCADGVCCDRACTGLCEACSSTKKGSGPSGTCGFIGDGSDPDRECASATCTSTSTLTFAKVCDGAGACRGNGSTGCGNYACQSGACAVSCSGDTDCASTHYCLAGACVIKRAVAETCTAARECASGYCADGVCCDRACTGRCEACSAEKKGSAASGTCGPIVDGTDPDKECPGAFCSSISTATNAQVCDGAGACRANGTTTCVNYACSAGSCASTCTSDSACASTHYCVSGSCISKRAVAEACTANRECASGVCADGVCCDRACTAGCEACSAAKKGSGADGVCGPVAADTDPKNACVRDSLYPNNCGADGLCNGAGACRTVAAAGTVCGASTCTSGSTVARTCNSIGLCQTTSTSCAPYACASATSCATSCTTDAQCATTHFCGTTNLCEPRKANGSVCSTASECTSGMCADGVCCNSACVGQCEACNLTGSEGVCSAVTGTPRGGRAACVTTPTACAGTCNGTNRVACTYPSGNACGTACTTGTETPSTCNGAGACVASEARSCGAYACDAATGACEKACTSNAQCAERFVCTAGACVPAALGDACTSAAGCPTGTHCTDGVCCTDAICSAGLACNTAKKKGTCAKVAGIACKADAECGTGVCADEVCCDRACNGQCEACDVTGSVGTCAPVKGAPHGVRTACTTDPTNVCASLSCDGADTTKCAARPGAETVCKTAACVAGTATKTAHCDGTGACVGEPETACAPYACDEKGEACATSCSTECAAGSVCTGGVCGPAAAVPVEDQGGCAVGSRGAAPRAAGVTLLVAALAALAAPGRRRRGGRAQAGRASDSA